MKRNTTKKWIVISLVIVTVLCLLVGLFACEWFDFSSLNSKSDGGEDQAQTDNGSVNGSDDTGDGSGDSGSGSGDTGSGSGDSGSGSGGTHTHTAGEAVMENEVAATCTEDGSYDTVVSCTVCGKELSRETVAIPATGHTAGEGVIENETATCTEDGSYDTVIYCTICGEELSRETALVSALGHDYVSAENGIAVDTSTGNVYTEICSRCKIQNTIEGYTYKQDNDRLYTVLTAVDTTQTGTSITIPYYTLTVGNGSAISSKLTSVTVPDSVTSIGNQAFSNCTSLTSVTIGSSVMSIEFYAFYNCTSLTSITIPDSMTSIGGWAFSGCSSLTSVYYNGTASQWASISFYNDSANPLCNTYTRIGNLYTVGNLYLNGTLAENITLEGITAVNAYAFYKCDSLTSIAIGSGVTSIGDGAFCLCELLSSITIGNSVTSIGGDAFNDCRSLASVIIPNSVTSIGDYAFCNCTSLVCVTIGSGVMSIGSYAFFYCTSLTSITIPNSVKSIGAWAFYNCSSLTSVYYSGTASDWSAISIGSDNTYLANSTRYYYAENDGTTTAVGNYWYYDGEGNIKTWSIE